MAIPTLNVSVDKNATYKSTVNLVGTLTDTSPNTVRYKISLNGVVKYDWSALSSPPVNINTSFSYSDFNLGNNTLLVEYKNNLGSSGSWSTTVKRKTIDSAYVSNSEVHNFDATLKVNDHSVAFLSTDDVNRAEGYVLTATLKLNSLNGNGSLGTIKIAPIITEWSSDRITANNIPNIDITQASSLSIVNNSGIINLDIKEISKIIFIQGNYGVALYTTNCTIEFDVLSISTVYTYQITEIVQPPVVFGNKVSLEWESLILKRPEAYIKTKVQRDTSQNFTNPTTLYEIVDKTASSYEDASLTSPGTYYYRIAVEQINYDYSGNKLDFDLADESNFIQEDNTKTDFVSGTVQISSILAATVTQDMSNSNGFTFDNTKVEFVSGKVQLKVNVSNQTIILPAVSTITRWGITSVAITDSTSQTGTTIVYENMVNGGALGSGYLWTKPLNYHATGMEVV